MKIDFIKGQNPSTDDLRSYQYSTDEFLDFFKDDLKHFLNAKYLCYIIDQGQVFYNTKENRIYLGINKTDFATSLSDYLNRNFFCTFDRFYFIPRHQGISFSAKSYIFKKISEIFEIHTDPKQADLLSTLVSNERERKINDLL